MFQSSVQVLGVTRRSGHTDRMHCRGFTTVAALCCGKQVHFPFPYLGGMDALAEGMAAVCERGLCRSVGVSNFNAKQVRQIFLSLFVSVENFLTCKVMTYPRGTRGERVQCNVLRDARLDVVKGRCARLPIVLRPQKS